jgi:hypothetical protein
MTLTPNAIMKGKCALGPFPVVLVITCSIHYYELTLLL